MGGQFLRHADLSILTSAVVHNINKKASIQWERVTKRKEPRSSRSSALNATPLKRAERTSKARISTVSLDVNRDLPTDTPTLLLTRRVVLSGLKILSLNTLRTPRSTLRYVYVRLVAKCSPFLWYEKGILSAKKRRLPRVDHVSRRRRFDNSLPLDDSLNILNLMSMT